MKVFSEEELARYDGKGSPAYVALDGKVYDVSASFHWRGGRHQALHEAGLDLTEALKQAPHGVDFIKKFPVIGVLVRAEP